MDSSNSNNAGHRGRRDRRDGKTTQTNRSRSRPSRPETTDSASGSSRPARVRPSRSRRPPSPPPPYNPLLERLRPRKVLDDTYIINPSGKYPNGTFPRSQRERLVDIAEETQKELPRLLSQVSMGGGVSAQMAATQHKVYNLHNLKKLDPAQCPGLPSVVIRVTREDTLTAAIRLAREANAAASAAASAKAASRASKNSKTEKKNDRNLSVSTTSSSSSSSSIETPPYPLIVSFANETEPGGSWTNGAMAQEEALFYRTSLSLSCDSKSYPLQDKSVLYSPCVFVIREEFAAGHKFLKPEEFPVVSAISVAAVRQPAVHKVQVLKVGQAKKKPVPTPQPMMHTLPLRLKSLRSHTKPSENKGATAPAASNPFVAAPLTQRPMPPPPTPSESFSSLLRPPPPSISESAAPKRQASVRLTMRSRTAAPPLSLTKLPPTRPSPAAAGTTLASTKRSASSSASLASNERYVFSGSHDRDLTKTKMRLVLRAATTHGHRQLVLGALGCGVYANPPDDVARCWLEVLQEEEFIVPADEPAGEPKHWWKDVVFAVYEKPKRPDGTWVRPNGIDGDGDDGVDGTDKNTNYEVFRRILDGKLV